MITQPCAPVLFAACMLVLAANTAHGGTPADSLLSARLEVTADMDSAAVFLDTLQIGRTPLIRESVPPGPHVIRIVPPQPEAWAVQPVVDTVRVLPGETHVLSYRLRTFIPIRSDPGGAQLFLNDSLAGVTPLLVRSSDIHPDTRVELRMRGFEPVVVLPSALAGETVLSVALKAGSRGQAGEAPPAVLALPSWDPRTVGRIVSGGVSILAGIGAAYFKVAADGKQEAYLATGDPALAAERRRLDTLAGVSLVLAQAGIIVLSYLLITE